MADTTSSLTTAVTHLGLIAQLHAQVAVDAVACLAAQTAREVD